MRKPPRKEEVTKNMTFEELTSKYPEVVSSLFEKGLHCVGCHAAHTETIEQGALVHGINPDKLVKEINLIISREKKKND
jgi:hybrid cluster-associated redox disulfide protein